MFYIGTSYLMNVHFGSKDFHLSCFGGIAYEKTLPPTPLVSYNKVRGHICIHTYWHRNWRLHPFKMRGLFAIRDFKMQPHKRFVANFAMHKFHQVKKDACVNSCFAVLSSLVVRIKVWDNIYLIALAWVPV